MNREQRRKNEKQLRRIAKEIIFLEKELRLGKNVKENQDKIENIMSALSFEEVLYLDAYIQENI